MDPVMCWAGQRILVTGGAGFIGSRLIYKTAPYDIEVHSFSHTGRATKGAIDHTVDLRNLEQVERFIRQIKPDLVFHLAASGVTHAKNTFDELMQTNVLGFKNLLEAMRRNEKVIPLIVAGSGFEYGSGSRLFTEADPLLPINEYGVSKASASIMANYFAKYMPITLMRVFSVYGIGERLPRLAPYIIDCALKGVKAELTHGEQLRDYVYVDDVAEAFWRAAALSNSEGKLCLMNLASGTILSVKDFVLQLVKILEQYELSPNVDFGAKPYHHDEPMFYAADITQMQQLLGWTPKTPLEFGLQNLVEATIVQS